jgi:hypothetical protein
MTNRVDVDVDISGAARTFRTAGMNEKKAVPTLLARLSFKGESFMKGAAPVRTGTLRRSLHAYPTVHPAGLASSVKYAWAANVRSRKPRYIEKTRDYIVDIHQDEAHNILKKAFRGMDK